MKNTISRNELERACGITYRTILNYVKAGWLPQAKLVSYGQGSGRGSSKLHWDMSIVTQILMIKTLKKAGYRDHQIDKILKGESL